MVVAVLFTVGDQLPEMPLLEVVGSEKLPPEQIGAICVKLGVTFGLTVTVIVELVAHCPELGVKV